MQPKSVSKKNVKTAALKDRLKPISLEEPLTGSPFLKIIEDEPDTAVAQTTSDLSKTNDREGKRRSINQPTEPDLDATNSAPASTPHKQRANAEKASQTPPDNLIQEKPQTEVAAASVPEQTNSAEAHSREKSLAVPRRETQTIAPRKLCKLLEVDDLDDIFSLNDLLKASSLKLYATLVRLSDKNGRLKIKAHELMRAAGIKGIATYYKQERWLNDLGLIEKRAKPGPHEGSSYRVYSLETLPVSQEILDEFKSYLQRLDE